MGGLEGVNGRRDLNNIRRMKFLVSFGEVRKDGRVDGERFDGGE